LFVDVNQDVAVNSLEQARAVDFAGLEDDVAVGEDDDRAPLFEVVDDVEGGWVEPIGERIVNEVVRDGEQVGIARGLDAVALKDAQVVGVAKLGAERLEDPPVALGALLAALALELALEIGGDAVVVEQGVVDVDEEDDVMGWHGGYAPSLTLPRRAGEESIS